MDTRVCQVTREGQNGGTWRTPGGVTGTWGMFGDRETQGEHGGGGGHGWDTSPTGNARNVPDKTQGGSSPDTPAPPPAPFRGPQGVPKEGRGLWTPGGIPWDPRVRHLGDPAGKMGERGQKGLGGGRWGKMG